MSAMPEPILDMYEIVDLYKEDARQMVNEMRAAANLWQDVVAGGPARQTLRKLSHQLRGSGRTYGFRSVSRISKAVEQIMIKMESRGLAADDRAQKSVFNKIDRLAAVFGK
jgi:chemotaxis protein histidine kinase CheA